jgi:glutaminase
MHLKEMWQQLYQLAKVSPNKFGIHLTTIDGDDFGVGDSDEKFSIQVFQKR